MRYNQNDIVWEDVASVAKRGAVVLVGLVVFLLYCLG